MDFQRGGAGGLRSRERRPLRCCRISPSTEALAITRNAAIFARRVLLSGRMTLTESSLGLTTQIKRSVGLIAIGLE